MKHRKPIRRQPIQTPNNFKVWPHQPEYAAVALVRKGGLWAVIDLRLKAREVVEFDATTETSFEFAIDKAIRKLTQSVRRIP